MYFYKRKMLFIAMAISLGSVSAQFVTISFNNTRPVGPDGPWLPLTLGTGSSFDGSTSPSQYVDFYPTFNALTNWFVASLNCEKTNQSCPEPAWTYYDSTQWSALFNPPLSSMENSSAIQFAEIYGPSAQLLGINGSFGFWHQERLVIPANDGYSNLYWAGGLSQVTSNYTNVEFPNKASYVPISLMTLDPTDLYLPKGPNFTATDSSLLSDLKRSNTIASSSWSMHIGSYAQKINGSLVVGGYDPSRVIGQPGIFSNNSVELVGISLGASDGGYSWEGRQLGQNYLSGGLNTLVTPTLPYLNLPASICSALAEDIPILYNAGFNLYEWQVNSSSYSDIITSPSYLNFTFSDYYDNLFSIRVPFTLLNLTLDTPLVQSPISYFPCSPSTSSSSFALGRAFLQAAFTGQNYNSSTFWLGQAPGPSGLKPSSNIKLINPSDTAIVPDPTGITWEQSWSGVLKAIPSATSATNGSSDQDTETSTLPKRAIAGIVIGVVSLMICVMVIALLWLRRRRKQSAQTPGPTAENGNILVEAQSLVLASELPVPKQPVSEAPGDIAIAEKDDGQRRF